MRLRDGYVQDLGGHIVALLHSSLAGVLDLLVQLRSLM
jgi:hypothetical protein